MFYWFLPYNSSIFHQERTRMYIYAMEHFGAIKRGEEDVYKMFWTDHQDILLSEPNSVWVCTVPKSKS